MSEPTAHSFTQLFSQLTGCKVAFTQPKAAAPSKVKQMYGLYTVLPYETVIVVKSDLPLLASFAGTLVGLPDDAVRERLGTTPLDEVLRDAIHEVLNISATLVTNEGRAVFKKMAADPIYFENFNAQLLQKPDRKTEFDVSIEGYQGGKFTIFAQR